MDLFEKALVDLLKAVKEQSPSIEFVEFEVPSGSWRSYAKRAIELINRSIVWIKEFKKLIYERTELLEEEPQLVPVVFLKDLNTSFVGPDARTVYGPYKKGDVVYMHKDAAKILEEKKIVRRLRIRSMVLVILDSGEPSKLGIYVGEDVDRYSLSYYEVPPRIVDTVTDRIWIVTQDEVIAYVVRICDRKPLVENAEILELSKLKDGEYVICVKSDRRNYVIYARKEGRYYLIMHVFDVIDKTSKRRYLPIERTLLSHSEFSKISECLLEIELYGLKRRDSLGPRARRNSRRSP